MMSALSIEKVRKEYFVPGGRRRVVLDIDELRLSEGEQAACSGASGSGKTTLLNIASGILKPDSGSVWIGDTEITLLTESRRDRVRGERIGIVYQTFNLLQGFTARENVEIAMRFGAGVDPVRARALLDRVGLSDRTDDIPSSLSVGQQQRVAVARALANRPTLVLADEPTGSLDPDRSAEALTLLMEICREYSAALLVVSHDPTVLASFERRIDLHEINRGGDAE